MFEELHIIAFMICIDEMNQEPHQQVFFRFPNNLILQSFAAHYLTLKHHIVLRQRRSLRGLRLLRIQSLRAVGKVVPEVGGQRSLLRLVDATNTLLNQVSIYRECIYVAAITASSLVVILLTLDF